MYTENGWVSAAKLVDRRHGGSRFCRAVADQGRKQGSGAEPAMRRDDASYGFRCGCIIEQNIAAAVDLKVDKAWRQPDSFRQFMDRQIGRKLGARHESLDAVTRDDNRGIAMRDGAVKDTARGDCARLAAGFGTHRVRVTFCKCRGRSASVPRCAASLTNEA